MESIEMIKGHVHFPKLNTELTQADYAIAKVYVWASMLDHNQAPTNWRSDKSGTKVDFEYIQTIEKDESAVSDLLAYIAEVNAMYKCDLVLK